MVKVIHVSDLQRFDLIVDAVYEGGDVGNSGDDPSSKPLTGIGNQ